MGPARWYVLAAFAVACGGSQVDAPVPASIDGGITVTSPDSGAPAGDSGTKAAACPIAGKGTVAGTVSDKRLTEVSGLAASQKTTGIFWTHNDSGDSPRVFALRDDATVLAEVAVDGATAVDWEAIQVAKKDGVPSIYVGDIGDNAAKRTSIAIYVLAEPAVAPAPTHAALTETLTLHYEDGPHNAETLLVSGDGTEIVVVTKVLDGVSGIYRLDRATSTLVRKGTLTFGKPPLGGNTLATDGSVSDAFVVVRTYDAAFAWPRSPGASIVDALAGTPCPLALEHEKQGESIALLPDSSRYYTTSESKNQPLWRFALE